MGKFVIKLRHKPLLAMDDIETIKALTFRIEHDLHIPKLILIVAIFDGKPPLIEISIKFAWERQRRIED